MADRYPVAYIRRSTADDSNPGDVSREAQEAAVRDLAARDGHNGELRLFVDWGRSADEAKEAKRAAFLSMLASIERGEVSSVYAYALDRLYRSMRTFVRLTDAARTNGVRIVTTREGVLGGDGSPMARAFAEITAVFASLELNTIKARNQGAAKARKDRGDAMGQPPYGSRIVRDDSGRAVKPIRWEDDPARPLAPVLEAYTRARSVLGACKILNAAGIATPKGKVDGNGEPVPWQPTSLTLILDRAGVLPPHGKRREYAKGARLAGLLRCHCGRFLTPDHSHLRTGTAYYCARSKWIGTVAHGPGYVHEDALMPLIKEEMAHLDVPDAYSASESHTAERTALLERRRRLAVLYADTLIDDDGYRSERDAITKALDDLGDASYVVDVPGIDWDAPVADVNEALRAFLARIELDASMRPSGPEAFIWRVPGMRRA